MDERDIRKARHAINTFLRENGNANLLGQQVQVKAQIIITLYDSGEINFLNPSMDEIMTRFLLSKGEAIYNEEMAKQSRMIMETRREVSTAKPSDAEDAPNA